MKIRHIKEFVIKGFVMDDEQLKKRGQPFDYFEELLRRIPMHMVDWITKLDRFLTLNPEAVN